jgi:uncharacterized protein (TIGR02265 family)
MKEVRYTGEEAIQSLLLGCGIKEKPALQRVIKEQFAHDYDNPRDIPFEKYVEIVEYLRETLYPFRNSDEGYLALGKAVTAGGFQGVMGTIRKSIGKVLPPEKVIELFLKDFITNTPFARSDLEEARKGYIRWRVGNLEGAPPKLLTGVLTGMYETFNLKNLQVKDTQIDSGTFVYEIFWE